MNSIEYTSPPKRVILGDIGQNGNSPISPMANLKLLIKVATRQFADQEDTPKQDNNNEEKIIVHKTSRQLPDKEVPLRKINNNEKKIVVYKTSRQDRSLSFICKKFLSVYALKQEPGHFMPISLGCLASELGIEKRRVYDIINVVSSLQMAVKICKDKYHWYGYQKLPQLLSKLKAFALFNNFDTQVREYIKTYPQLSLNAYNNKLPIECSYLKITEGNSTVFEENRIGVLCQKFIMLFLVCDEVWPLNLTVISKLILSKDIPDKTGMRRLYDVANVLEALGLVKKYSHHEFKKPTYVYCGPKVEAINSFEPEDVFNDQSVQTDAFSDTNSESSMDAVQFKKLTSSFSMNIEEKNFEPTAKKRLMFPQETTKTIPYEVPIISKPEKTVTFIKAPASSFQISSNCITAKPPEKIHTIQLLPKKNYETKKPVFLKRLGPMKVVENITLSNIQNGAIYRAIVSKNNSVQFVKL